MTESDRHSRRLRSGVPALAALVLLGSGLVRPAVGQSIAHQKRFKEMGIRKVLGSTSTNIILLVSRKFIVLIGLATLIASPITWWLLNDWLEQFAYKVNLNPLIFLASGLGVITVTFISISIQSLKVSHINPSEALRMD